MATIFFVFAKGADIDNGVGTVVIHIGYGCKIHVNTQPPAFLPDGLAHFFDERIVLNGAQSHLFGVTHATVQAHAQSPFGIHPDHERDFCFGLVKIDEIGLPYRTALEKNKPAHMVLFNAAQHSVYMCGIPIAISRDHEKLPDLFFGGELFQERVGPKGSLVRRALVNDMLLGSTVFGSYGRFGGYRGRVNQWITKNERGDKNQ